MRRVSMLAGSIALALASTAEAAEIKLMSSGGMKVMLIDLIGSFERATGHQVTAIYGAPGVIKDRIAAGEAVDMLVFPTADFDDLVRTLALRLIRPPPLAACA